MTIGERIKQRREELGLSQEELAKKVGYKSRSSINKIEISRDLPLRKVEIMAKALETTPAYLMGWIDTPQINQDAVDELHDNVNSARERNFMPDLDEETLNRLQLALEMYEKYCNAIPEVQAAVETLLTKSKPRS